MFPFNFLLQQIPKVGHLKTLDTNKTYSKHYSFPFQYWPSNTRPYTVKKPYPIFSLGKSMKTTG